MSPRPEMNKERLKQLEEFNNENSLDMYCDIFFDGDFAEIMGLARLGLWAKNDGIERMRAIEIHGDLNSKQVAQSSLMALQEYKP